MSVSYFSPLSDYILGAVIVLSNSILLVAVARTKELRKKEYVLMAGVATFDLLFGVGSVVSGVHEHYRLLTGTEHANTTVLARMVLSSGRHLNPVANLGYLCLTIDRVIAVVWYQSYLKLRRAYAFKMLALACSYGVMSVVACVVVLIFYVDPWTPWPALEPFWVPPFALSKISASTCILCAYLSVILYGVVCMGHRKMISHEDGSNLRDQQLERQKRLNKTIGVLVLFTLVCEALPLTAIVAVPADTLGFFRPLLFSLTRVNCFVNVCVLYWRQAVVRKAINTMFGKKTAVVSVSRPKKPIQQQTKRL